MVIFHPSIGIENYLDSNRSYGDSVDSIGKFHPYFYLMIDKYETVLYNRMALLRDVLAIKFTFVE